MINNWVKGMLRYNKTVSDEELSEFIERSKNSIGCAFGEMEINLKMPFALHEIKKRNKKRDSQN